MQGGEERVKRGRREDEEKATERRREVAERMHRECREGAERARSACAAACSDALGDTPSSSARSSHGGLIRIKARVRVRSKSEIRVVLGARATDRSTACLAPRRGGRP